MLLGVIPMICFEILSDFKRKSQKREIGKFCIFGFLRHSVGNPRRGVALRRSVGCLATARPRYLMSPKTH